MHRSLATITLAVALLGGCSSGPPIRWQLHATVERPRPGAVIFLVDGLPPRCIEEGCRDGWLPNIRARFYERGLRVENAITCMPSITYAAIATILTGASPAEHGIIGNHWYDPDTAVYRDYATIRTYRAINEDLPAPLVYERLAPAPTASIQAAHVRGVSRDIVNWANSGVRWFFKNYTSVDKLTASSVWLVANWANRQGEWPALLTCYMPGVDSVGHVHGPDSDEFRAALEHADHQVGRVCDWLESQGLLESTYLILLSDHGMATAGQHIDLMQLMQGWGRTATNRPLQDPPEERRHAYFAAFDTVVDDRDGRRASLHLRPPHGWRGTLAATDVAAILNAPPPEQQLWNLQGIDLVAHLEGENAAVLRRGPAQARILVRAGAAGPEYVYQPETGDPLGYLRDPKLAAFVQAGPHDSREWLAATADVEFPDVVPHLVPLLRLRRSGQVVLFAAPGYSFVQERGGHGGIRADEMRMTFMVAGPGIDPGTTRPHARAVDVVPTLLALLQDEPPHDSWLPGLALLPSSLYDDATAAIAK